MASRDDLELAKRLMTSAVLGEPKLREALEIQAEVLARGKVVSLERVLIVKGFLPPDAAKQLHAGDPLQVQPFPNSKLDRVLGEGGSSIVYGGRYLPNKAPVAVKVLNPLHGLRPDLVARFDEEARLLISLEHENVVQGYEVGFENGFHYFSMDLIEGPTILEMIDRGGHIENVTARSEEHTSELQ